MDSKPELKVRSSSPKTTAWPKPRVLPKSGGHTEPPRPSVLHKPEAEPKPKAKSRYMDISELRDSREMMEAKPHAFFTIFTLILLAILSGALIWMAFSAIDVYIKATGIVRPTESISAIRSLTGGKLKDVNITDGQMIYKGDVLYTLDKQAVELQWNSGGTQLSEAQEDLNYLRLYRNCIEANENLLSAQAGQSEKANRYSLLVDQYLLEREISMQQIAEDKTNSETMQHAAKYAVESASHLLGVYQEELSGLRNYRAAVEKVNELADRSALTSSSMNAVTNQFAQNNSYDAKLSKYLTQIEALTKLLVNAQTTTQQTKKLFEGGAAAKQEYDNALAQENTAKAQLDDFKNAEMVQIEQSIKDAQRSAEDVNIQLQKAENDKASYGSNLLSPEMMIEQTKLARMTQIDNQIRQIEETVRQLETEMEALSLQMRDLDVVAPIDGVLNLSYQLNPGDLLQAGVDVGTIVPLDSDAFKVTFMVSNKDIANVKVGQLIKCKFLALPYQEYGTIDAKVSQISSDIRSDANAGDGLYAVEAVLENKPIKSYKGVDETIKVGMIVEGRVVSDTKTILRWGLEKLNFLA